MANWRSDPGKFSPLLDRTDFLITQAMLHAFSQFPLEGKHLPIVMNRPHLVVCIVFITKIIEFP
ncbi:MAG: hypothetical protein RLZZ224_206 [Verrucomicrobiota bacterium]|jgi:hypothetical protein